MKSNKTLRQRIAELEERLLQLEKNIARLSKELHEVFHRGISE